jgi:hypothetical protein
LIEAFHIGVALDMKSNAAGTLSGVNREILGVHQGVSRATAALGQFRLAFAGLGAMTVGGGIPTFMRHIETADERLAQSQAMLQAARGGTAATQEPLAEATREVPAARVTAEAAAIRDLRGVFGDLREAMIMLPRLLREQARRASSPDARRAFSPDARRASSPNARSASSPDARHTLSRDARHTLSRDARPAPSRDGTDGGGAFLAARIRELRGGPFNANGSVNEARQIWWSAKGIPPYAVAGQPEAGAPGTRQAAAIAGQAGLPAPGTSIRGMQATTVRLQNDRPFVADPIQLVVGTLMPALKAHGGAAGDTADVARIVGRIVTDRMAGEFVSELARGIIMAHKEGSTVSPVAPGADVPAEWRNALRFCALRALAPPPAAAGVRWFETPHDEHNDGPRGAPVPRTAKTEGDADAPLPLPNASYPDRVPFIITMDGREIARGLARRADGALSGTGGFDGRRNMLATT